MSADPAPRASGQRPPAALFLIDKPAGPTSHDIVNQLRRLTGVRRIGHAGTLDPLATGLLPLFVGPATRLIEYLAAYPKRYTARLRLGISTDTDDAHGDVIAEAPVPPLTRAQIDAAAMPFRGAISQVPPTFSAVKVKGVVAHRAARRGDPLPLQARAVTVHALTIDDWQPPELRIAVTCSTGTYVRAIARDLGAALGCGAHLVEMRRTAIGAVSTDEAITPDALEAAFAAATGWEHAVPLDRFFEDWQRVVLADDQVTRLIQGQPLHIQPREDHGSHLLAKDRAGRVVAVLAAASSGSGLWRPAKVLRVTG